MLWGPALWITRFDFNKLGVPKIGLRLILAIAGVLAVELAIWHVIALRIEYSRKSYLFKSAAETRRKSARDFLEIVESSNESPLAKKPSKLLDYIRELAKADLEMAEYQDLLYRKYELAAQTPWLPVAADPLPPKRPKPPFGFRDLDSYVPFD